MRSILRRLLKFVVTVVILLVICVGISAAVIFTQRSSAEREIDEQLAALDQRFNIPRNSLLSAFFDETIMPEQVGSFQRGEIARSTDTRCTWNLQEVEWCLSTVYKKDGDTASTIWMRVWEKSDRGVQSLAQMTGYHLCSIPFIGKPILYGIAWQNGEWFIGIEGKYEDYSQFIATYPLGVTHLRNSSRLDKGFKLLVRIAQLRKVRPANRYA